MSNPTSNFNWQMPTATDLVTDLPADFEVFGQAVDNTVAIYTTEMAFNAQTGTTYTLVVGDLGKWVTCSNASAITVTIPPSVFATGNTINVQQIGAGQVTFAQGAGVTITSTGATASAPKLRTQYSGSTVVCTGSNAFTIVGDLA
jgi:hypothetical protein